MAPNQLSTAVAKNVSFQKVIQIPLLKKDNRTARYEKSELIKRRVKNNIDQKAHAEYFSRQQKEHLKINQGSHDASAQVANVKAAGHDAKLKVRHLNKNLKKAEQEEEKRKEFVMDQISKMRANVIVKTRRQRTLPDLERLGL